MPSACASGGDRLLKAPPKTTFSDAWYRVAKTRPRLSPHAAIVRQIRAGRVTYVVEEPASGNYYRISDSAYFFVGFLDGKTTIDEAWDACNAQLGDDAPTQRECIEVLSKLQMFGLLIGEAPLNPDMITERRRRAATRRLHQRTGMWVFPSIPVIDPERFLERHRTICSLLFSKGAFVLWLALVGTALWFVARNADRLLSPLQNILSPANLIWMSIVFLLLRALHEFGHAVACKAFGGRVTEIGLIMIAYVLPIPYCDATSSWRFASTTQRVVVSAGGILAETVLAAIAAIVWASTREGDLIHTLSYNTMLISGLTTFVFNLNPLLRYDGYYILSDVTDIPNLAQRSKELWKYGAQRFLFGVKNLRPPHVRTRAELTLLWIYHALAIPYRLFVLFAIGLVVATSYPGIGLLLVGVLVAVSILYPVLKGASFVVSSPVLLGHRARAVGVTLGGLALLVGVIGFVPVRDSSYGVGQVLPLVREPIRTEADGFIDAFLIPEGQTVKAGEPLLRMRSPEAEAELAAAEARLDLARLQVARASAESPAIQRVARLGLQKARDNYAQAKRIVDRLTVSAPSDGVIVSADPETGRVSNLVGRFAQRGTLVATLESVDEGIVRVAIPDRAQVLERDDPDAPANTDALLGQPVEIRLHGNAGALLTGRVISAFPAASRNIKDPALTAQTGGSIVLDPTDPSGERALNPFVIVEVRPDELPESWQPGQRARVRFPLPDTPLGEQWYRFASRYFRARIG